MNFLFEIGTEELPAGAVPKIVSQVKELANKYLVEERLCFGDIKVLATPRRIALLINDINEKAEDLKEEHKGPSVKIAYDENGQPTKAAIGFAKGKGIEPTELVVKDDYIYAETFTAGKTAKEILTAMLANIINGLSFPKSMHWANYDEKFIRPVRWFVTLLNEELIEFQFAGAKSSKITRGHRFLGASEIEINHPSEYIQKLKDNFIIVDQNERKNLIVEQLENIALAKNGRVIMEEDLLEEVTYLVEYPTALCGDFDEMYLELPPACVVTPMKDHQRYFPLVDADGKLRANFLTVRNGDDRAIEVVQAGNERVLKARLEDARFFFNEDRKTSLENKLPNLDKIVFQEGLGNMSDKTLRLIELTKLMAMIYGSNAEELAKLERAAKLAKADLTTGMVTEFTELQGIMGKEYALLDGEDKAVAEAIYEQYLPRFAGDILPQTDLGLMLSIADKIDNIVATFSRGLIPTGSQDPYALRRQTIGILNSLIAKKWNMPFNTIFVKAAELLKIEAEKIPALLEQLNNFFVLRLKNIYLERNWSHEIVDLLLSHKEISIANNELLGAALLENKVYENEALVQAFTRIYNLVKDVKLDRVDAALLKEVSEIELNEAVVNAHAQAMLALQLQNYDVLVNIPQQLIEAIAKFFENVMVMDKDEAIKNNRLQLLRLTYELFANIGDISVLK